MRDVNFAQSGLALVMTLVILVMFLVMMIVGAGLVNQQLHLSGDQEQEQGSFEMADAGVHYALWLLNDVEETTPDSLVDNPIVSHLVEDPDTQEKVGEFDLTFDCTQNTSGNCVKDGNGFYELTLTAVGRASADPELAQTVLARLQEYNPGSGSVFYVELWHHQLFGAEVEAGISSVAGYWRLDEASAGGAGSVIDDSGYGNHGTPLGSSGSNNLPQPSADVAAGFDFTNPRGLNFDGTDDHVELPSNLDSSQITVAAWIKAATHTTIMPIFANKVAGCASDVTRQGFAFYVNQDNLNSRRLRLEYRTPVSGCRVVNTGDGAILPDVWYHVAATINEETDTIKLFINGQPVAQGGFADGMTTRALSTNPKAYIGRYVATALYNFKGNIDDLRLYHRVLSDSEIGDLATGGHVSVNGPVPLVALETGN